MQNIEGVGVTRKILWNKDLAAVVGDGRCSAGWEVGKSGRCFGVCMRSRRRGTRTPSSSSEEMLGEWMWVAIGRGSRECVTRLRVFLSSLSPRSGDKGRHPRLFTSVPILSAVPNAQNLDILLLHTIDGDVG